MLTFVFIDRNDLVKHNKYFCLASFSNCWYKMTDVPDKRAREILDLPDEDRPDSPAPVPQLPPHLRPGVCVQGQGVSPLYLQQRVGDGEARPGHHVHLGHQRTVRATTMWGKLYNNRLDNN